MTLIRQRYQANPNCTPGWLIQTFKIPVSKTTIYRILKNKIYREDREGYRSNSKLNADQVRSIRLKMKRDMGNAVRLGYTKGALIQRRADLYKLVAVEYGVCEDTIRRIYTYRVWKNVK